MDGVDGVAVLEGGIPGAQTIYCLSPEEQQTLTSLPPTASANARANTAEVAAQCCTADGSVSLSSPATGNEPHVTSHESQACQSRVAG